MKEERKYRKGPPEINPYVFTVLLFLFGAWCAYDGWLTTDPEMQAHRLFNQVISGILLPWSVYDYFKVRKALKKSRTSSQEKNGALHIKGEIEN